MKNICNVVYHDGEGLIKVISFIYNETVTPTMDKMINANFTTWANEVHHRSEENSENLNEEELYTAIENGIFMSETTNETVFITHTENIYGPENKYYLFADDETLVIWEKCKLEEFKLLLESGNLVTTWVSWAELGYDPNLLLEHVIDYGNVVEITLEQYQKLEEL